MSYQNSCIFTLLDVHFRLPSPLASVTFLQLCIVTMYINHMKCWIRQAKPASKALLEHCEGTAEQGTPNSNSEKRGTPGQPAGNDPAWAGPGDLQRSFPASGILLVCDIFVEKKFFMLLCFISHCSPNFSNCSSLEPPFFFSPLYPYFPFYLCFC